MNLFGSVKKNLNEAVYLNESDTYVVNKTPYGFTEVYYKGYTISNMYGNYTVDIAGDVCSFDSFEDAKAEIDKLDNDPGYKIDWPTDECFNSLKNEYTNKGLDLEGTLYTTSSDEEVKKVLSESQGLKESSAEDYWDATEIARAGFMALLKFNFGYDSKGNNYIIILDNNEVLRFVGSSDDYAKEVFDKVRKEKESGVIDISNWYYDKIVESEKKSLKESVDLKNKKAVIEAFDAYLEDKYSGIPEQVLEDDVNDFFSDVFYDIETEEDLDNSNIAEEFIRKEYKVDPTEDSYFEPDEDTLKEADVYEPKYRILDKGLYLYNGNWNQNVDTVFGRVEVKSKDTVGNTFDIVYTPETNDLKVFPLGTDVRTLVEELYNIDSPETENEWFMWHGNRIQRKAIQDIFNDASTNISEDMEKDIIYGLDKLLDLGDIDKIIGGYQD